MTRLRFVGDLPLWLGVVLSIVVALVAWRFYRRESYELTPRLRWILPALRSAAFFLGVMILTGPVMHHRETIGEPGRIKIYVDASKSMSILDRHIPNSRKLLIAEQQGWLESGRIESQLHQQSGLLTKACQEVLSNLQGSDPKPSDVVNQIDVLLDAVTSAQSLSHDGSTGEPKAVQQLQNVANKLRTLKADANASPATAVTGITAVLPVVQSASQQLLVDFEAKIDRLVDSDDRSVNAALAIFDETPRWRRAERSLLAADDGIFEALKQQHHVEVLALHNETAVEVLDGNSMEDTPEQLPASPDATSTDLTGSISAQQNSTLAAATSVAVQGGTASQSNTAIVLITDGQHNSGASPLQAARVLGNQGIPVYPVSLGATQRAPDVAIVDIAHPELVFSKERVRGSMVIRDHMPAGRAMTATIAHEGDTVWQKQLITEGIGDRTIEFEFGIEDLVKELDEQFDSDVRQHSVPVSLVASVNQLPDEAEQGNNQMPFRFAAVTQSYRILIIDGRSRWETRYLRNAFERDSQWRVTAVISGPGTDDEVLPRGSGDRQFPESRDELFAFDFIIFGEVVPELLTDGEYEWIRDFVEIRGGGIVFIDGQRGRLKALTSANLGNLLPVEWLSKTISQSPRILQLTDFGIRVPALAFETEQEANKQFWNELPVPHTLNAVNALPGAEVLVEAVVGDEALPVMVTRMYGSGRVLYLASDETWRWRYKAADIYHQRIWNQLASYVMPRPFTASDEFLSIDTGPVSYDAGTEANMRIQLTGLDGRPSTGTTVDALLWKDGQVFSSVSLAEDVAIPGRYRGKSGQLGPGEYEVSIRASGFSQAALKAKSTFVVLAPQTAEMRETTCNEELLQQMAKDSGGVYLREEHVGQLAKMLSPLSSGRVVESETLLSQSYWWFSAVLILLTMEWFLRKRAGLL